MVISFRLGVQKVIVVNPSSRIHIPDGLIRSLCRHIDPFDLDFSPEKLNRWCMRSHFDFFSVRARDWIFFCPFSFFFSFLPWCSSEPPPQRKSFHWVDKKNIEKNWVPRVGSKQKKNRRVKGFESSENLKSEKNRELFEDRTQENEIMKTLL